MHEEHDDCWDDYPGCRQILTHYAEAPDATEEVPWCSRVDAHIDDDNEHWGRTHGWLIAMGYLDFDLTDRNAGLRYQITTSGNRLLSEIEKSIRAQETDSTEPDPELSGGGGIPAGDDGIGSEHEDLDPAVTLTS